MPIIKARSSSIISNIDLRGAPTVATATSGVSTSQIASTAFVRNAVTELINSAPDALDTLAELSAALGDDANFASTITGLIGEKLAIAGGTMTGFLILNDDPVDDLGAATKQYVDTAVAGVSFSSLGNTDNLDEGVLNLYFTEDRARSSIGLDSDNEDVLSYNAATGAFSFNWPTSDGLVEGVNNLFYTDGRVHDAIALNSDDQQILSYTSGTGTFTFSTPNTDKIDEGETNLYFTTARARNSISAGSNISYNSETGIISSTAAVDSVNGQSGTVVLDTDNIDEGSTNLYFTNSRASGSISLVTSDSNTLSYTGSTGVFTYVKPDSDGIVEGSTNLYYTNERVRLALSVTGDLTYNNTTGVLGFNLGNHDTDDLAEGAANLYFTEERVHAAISLTTDDSDILSYNGTNGAFTYNTPTTTKIAEGTNLYYTDDRARESISVTGWQISYNSSTGVITMATPTTTNVAEGTNLYYTNTRARNAISVSGDLTYSSETGVIGFSVGSISTSSIAEGTNLYYTDERVDDRVSDLLVAGSNITLTYDDPNGTLTVAGPTLTTQITEGTNLYYTDTRVRDAISAVDAGGDGSFSYDSETGAFTYTGPSSSEVRAHFSATTATGVTYNNSTGVIALASIPNSSLTNSSVTINGYETVLGGSVTLDTGDLAEDGNLFFTNARARSAISVSGNLTYDSLNGVIGFSVGSVSTTDVTEGTNLYFTQARARDSVSAVDAGGDGSFSYDSETGAFTYTGPSAEEVRAHFSATTVTGVTYDNSTGIIALASIPNSSLTNSSVTINGYATALGGSATLDTDDISEGSTNLYYTDARVQTKLGDVSGHILPDTDVTYDIGSAELAFRDLYLSGSTIYLGDVELSISSDSLVLRNSSTTDQVPFSLAANTTDDIAEGENNLYYTTSRVLGELSAGTGVTYNSSTGEFSIGQSVGTSDNVTFADVTVSGNLIVSGTTTTINTEEINLADNTIVLNSNATGAPSESSGIEIERGDATNVSLLWDETNDRWTIGSEEFQAGDLTVSSVTASGTITADSFVGSFSGQIDDLSNFTTNDLAEGTGEGANNLYYTDARARGAIDVEGWQISYNNGTGVITIATPDTSDVAEDPSATTSSGTMYFTNDRARGAVSAVDEGGDGSFSYDAETGEFTYTGPSSSEVRAHLSATTATGVTYDNSTGIIALASIPNSSLTNSSVTINGYETVLGGSVTLDTGDLAEDGNLFFTNARARGAISVSGNLTYDSGTGVIGFSVGNISTTDVTEGTNLYYTDTRVRNAISAVDAGGDGSFSYDAETGAFTYTGPSSSEVRAHLSATSATGVTYNNSTGIIALASIPNSSLTNSSITVNGYATALGGSVTLDTGDLAEDGNLFFTNARAAAAISLTSNNTAVLSYDSATGEFTFNMAASTTDNVSEGINNLYYTDERVDDRIADLFVAGDNITLDYDDVNGTFTIDGPTSTSEIAEGTNQYFTQARVRSAISLTTNDSGVMDYDSATGTFTFDSTGLNTDEITEGSTNLYFTNTRTRNAISVSGDLTYNSGTGVIGFALSNHDTDDLAEGTTNKYYTSTRVRNAISLTTDNTDAMDYDPVTGEFTFSLATVDTDEIAEGDTNLYFTTARARNSISAGSNISYDAATGIISSTAAVDSVNGQSGTVVLDTDDVGEGSTSLYFTNARARTAITVSSNDTGILSYDSGTGTLTFVKQNTDGVAEGSTNLYYTQARADARIAAASVFDLSDVDSGVMTDGYTLVWSTTTNSFVPQNIAITATTLNFTGDGSTTSFNTEVEISSIENTTVFINGLVQVPTYSYTLSTNSETGETSIVFDTAPESNDYIMVRVESTTQLTAGGILNENSTVDGGIF